MHVPPKKLEYKKYRKTISKLDFETSKNLSAVVCINNFRSIKYKHKKYSFKVQLGTFILFFYSFEIIYIFGFSSFEAQC